MSTSGKQDTINNSSDPFNRYRQSESSQCSHTFTSRANFPINRARNAEVHKWDKRKERPKYNCERVSRYRTVKEEDGSEGSDTDTTDIEDEPQIGILGDIPIMLSEPSNHLSTVDGSQGSGSELFARSKRLSSADGCSGRDDKGRSWMSCAADTAESPQFRRGGRYFAYDPLSDTPSPERRNSDILKKRNAGKSGVNIGTASWGTSSVRSDAKEPPYGWI
jgi:hypothetical protein